MAADPDGLLQFTAPGHVLGFKVDGVYIASSDHLLRVEFAGARGIAPVSGVAGDEGGTAPLLRVSYPGLWSGIDLRYEAIDEGIVESTWRIAPGASYRQIQLRYNAPVEIGAAGMLRINYETGWMGESAPVAWQQIDGRQVPVQVAFRIIETTRNETLVGFSVGQYDRAYPLLIDPVMQWNSFMGSSGLDEGLAMAVDSAGNVYVVGHSTQDWGGTPLNPHSGGLNNRDGFVAKLNGSGTRIWNTFLGSLAGWDAVSAIRLDRVGNIFISGTSDADWGLPINAYMGVAGNNNAFVAMLDNNGALQWNTFLGSPTNDAGNAIALDSSGSSLYVAGASDATWGTPLTPHVGGQDAFVAKLDSAGALQWHSFFGSATADQGNGVAVDGDGNIIVVGTSDASWGTLPIIPHAGGQDAFVAKLDSAGALQWHSFFGSAAADQGNGVVVDGSGALFVVGESAATWGTDPVTAYTGGKDLFIAELSGSGQLQWHSFVGAAGDDTDGALSLTASGGVLVAGTSQASWGAPINPFAGGQDAFVAELDGAGALQWNSFMGSTGGDIGIAAEADCTGNVFAAGTSSGGGWGTPIDGWVAPFANAFVQRVGEPGHAVCTTVVSGQGSFDVASQRVDDNTSASFQITPAAGYFIDSVSGCGGSWSGSNPYTTAPITANCQVTATFGLITFSVTPSPGSPTVLITGGEFHSLAARGDGAVVAWGRNNATQTDVPAGLAGVVAVSAGGDHSLALKSDGTIVPWGDGSFGLDTPPPGLSDVIAVSTGDTHSLAVQADGTVVAWGGNSFGQATVPTGLADVVVISAGGFHSLALKGDGTVAAWGMDFFHQATVPTGLSGVMAVVAGGNHSLALKRDGTVAAWGLDSNQQVSGMPAGLTGVVAIAAGKNHSLALKSDGTVVAWGFDGDGQATVPPGLTGVVSISAGGSHSLALKSDGTVVGWGAGLTDTGVFPEYGQAIVPASLDLRPFDGESGLILPNIRQTVLQGSTFQFTLVPKAGEIAEVSGSCGGSQNGNTFTSAPIVADCTVDAAFGAGQAVSASVDVNGSLDQTSKSVLVGSRASFTVTPNSGYYTNTQVGGDCPAGGSWSGSTYTTAPITGACSVSFSHTLLDHYLVTATVDANGSVDLASLSVPSGSTASFTVTADSGYTTDTLVGGSCPSGGAWSGSTYTTGPVTAACSVSFSHTLNSYSVTAGTDANGTVDAASVTVDYGTAASFTVTANPGYTTDSVVSGSCAAGSWTGTTYTTGAITAACSVGFSHTLNSYSVTADADANGTVDAALVTVDHGTNASFTVTANTGYTTDTAVSGSCPAGIWAGATYTTGTITADCSVSFSHTLNSYSVTAGSDANGTVDAALVTVDHGTNASFTVTADFGYTTDMAVSGSCAAGSWTGATYTTGAITAACDVGFSHTLNSYNVTASAGANGTVDAASVAVDHGTAASFTVTADAGYAIDSGVTGSCPAGSWAGDRYTTGAVTGDCTVGFSFSPALFTVSATAGAGGSVLPATRTVNPGSTSTFTVTADGSHTRSGAVGGTCPAGSWTGDSYTTGTITASCSVGFNFSADSGCSVVGGVMAIDNRIFNSGDVFGCHADVPVAIGPNVQINDGARVSLSSAVSVQLKDGVSVAQGAVFESGLATSKPVNLAKSVASDSSVSDGGASPDADKVAPVASRPVTYSQLPVALIDRLAVAAAEIDHASVDASGRYFVFSTTSPLIRLDQNRFMDIYWYDALTDQLFLVSARPDGAAANDASSRPVMDRFGDVIVYQSDASDLIANDTNRVTDVFITSTHTWMTGRISTDTNGGESTYDSANAAIDAAASWVAYDRLDSTGYRQIYQYSSTLQSTELLSIAQQGQYLPADNQYPVISGDGRYLAYLELDTLNTPGSCRVILRDQLLENRAQVACPAGVRGSAGEATARFSDDATSIEWRIEGVVSAVVVNSVWGGP